VRVLLHLTCWVASALEVWIALRLAARALDFAAVLVIESLLYAIRLPPPSRALWRGRCLSRRQ
jgi:hypothetical protein